MKNIATKSILKDRSFNDGLRICVMRRIHDEYDFDIWIPALAPTETLLQDYVIYKKISWDEFSKQYKKLILKKQAKLIKALFLLSQKNKITLLCSEDSYKKCHRFWIIEELKKYLKTKD